MRTSTDHILTTHVGSLPRPDDLIAANRAREAGEATDEARFQQMLRAAVAEVVGAQKDAGIDVPGDGEFGKSMGHRVNYGAWWSYAFGRLGGVEFGAPGPYGRTPRRSRPGEIVLTSQDDRRDRRRFAAAYGDPESGVSMGLRPATGPVCTGKLSYTGQRAVAADIANFKAALAAAGLTEGFMTAVAPGTAYRFGNVFYKDDAEFLYDCAEAMREEYRAILDAGLVLQLDDPSTATGWDMINPEPTLEDYKKFTMIRIEALNHALRGLPQDRIRYHLCWGSWHGPHTTDIAMRDIVEVMLAVNAQAYSFEAGNVRHEHEWKVWQEAKLPSDKIILPGVVSHATNVVEHPELVADRILRFANLVGRERVVASTDCGLGGRVHPQIAWAKLEALAQGAALATRQLWR
ncbi:MAG TPA: cobalamin-independent methionine synthase II family protein [Stellaceae bacterium]|nr:cobalamin-independent methionine synthase II family protein [Stellaceae bacterium]